MMYEKILVAIDDNDISQLALQESMNLARTFSSTLCIAHGFDAVTTNAYKRTDRDEFLAPQIETGQKILDRAEAAAREGGLQCEKRLLEVDALGRSRLPEVIVREADDCAAGLIVVGTHARRGMSHLLLGSVAEGILRIATTPVLVVPGKAEMAEGTDRAYSKLMVAVDGTETSAPALQEAIGFARERGATLRIVYAVAGDKDGGPASETDQPARDILQAAQARAREAGVEVEIGKLESSRQAGAIADAVAADATAWPAQLIVLATHGRQGLERLRMGSVAEAILRVAPTPVLLVRAAEPPAD